ncbi:MAG TPA: hypothetical protein PKH31_07920 [Candidatus Sumerlaeota bacterium]|nr:hypothetical protein [Candidatus Sumerlaeota bacterium]
MLRLLAEHEGYRYYLLLVDAIDTVTEWLPGPEHFSLFIYEDNKIEERADIDRYFRFAKSAILAGAECVWCGGLMGSKLDDFFDEKAVILELGLDPDVDKDLFPEDYFVMTLFDVDASVEELVWQFMSVSTNPELRDRVAVFQKDDVIGKWYEKTLMAWINGELELTED